MFKFHAVNNDSTNLLSHSLGISDTLMCIYVFLMFSETWHQ